jgi:spore coat protein H
MKSEKSTFFTPTSVHELVFTLEKSAWEAMEPAMPNRPNGNGAGNNPDPNQGGFGPPPNREREGFGPPPGAGGGFGPPPNGPGGPGGGPGMFGLDFPEVKASLRLDKKTYAINLRFKGNSSYMMSSRGLKRPFKVDFNKEKNSIGLTKLNLSNNFSDTTQVRETVCYEVFRRLGVPASGTTLARVVLDVPGVHDKKVLGLYTLVEQVDGAFLQERFGTGDGLLVKPEGARGGLPAFSSWKQYERIYDPKGKVTAEEKTRFMAFTKLVSNADSATFKREIEQYLDIDAFARFLAGNSVTSNGDSILSMGHNYYIWSNPKTKKYQFIPWDLNMAFGGFPMMSGDPVKLSVAHPHAGKHTLIDKFLEMPQGQIAYQKACREAARHLKEVGVFYDRVMASAKPIAAQDSPNAGFLPGFPGPGGPGGGGFMAAPPNFPSGPPNGRMRMPPDRPDLKTFLTLRADSVIAQLDGREKGEIPEMRMPGFPGGPGGFPGGPGGGFGRPSGRGGGGFGPPPSD